MDVKEDLKQEQSEDELVKHYEALSGELQRAPLPEAKAAELLIAAERDASSGSDDVGRAALMTLGLQLHQQLPAAPAAAAAASWLLQLSQKPPSRRLLVRALWCLEPLTAAGHLQLPELQNLLQQLLQPAPQQPSTPARLRAAELARVLLTSPRAVEVRGSLLLALWDVVLDDTVEVQKTVMLALQAGLQLPAAVRHSISGQLQQRITQHYLSRLRVMASARDHCPRALKCWALLLQYLGAELQRTSLINGLLKVVELVFRCQQQELRRAAFVSWRSLVDCFLAAGDLHNNPRRLKVLLLPLITPNAKDLATLKEKLLVWWHLQCGLGANLSAVFDSVTVPFLRLCFDMPVSSSAPIDLNTSTSDPKKAISVLRFPGLSALVRSALVHLLGGVWDEGAVLPPLTSAAVTAPLSVRQAALVSQCVACCLVTLPQPGLAAALWRPLVALAKQQLQKPSGREQSQAVAELVRAVDTTLAAPLTQDIAAEVTAVACQLAAVLPSWFLWSAALHVDSQPLSGAPALCLLRALGRRGWCDAAETVSQLVAAAGGDLLRQLPQLLQVMEDGEELAAGDPLLLWNPLASGMLRHVEQTQEVDTGDALGHDLSGVARLLAAPVRWPPARWLPLWGRLWAAARAAAQLVPTAAANELATDTAARISAQLSAAGAPAAAAAAACLKQLTEQLQPTSGAAGPSPRKAVTRRRSELSDPLAPLYTLLSQLTSSTDVLSDDVTGALAAAVRQLAGQVTAAAARASVTKLTAATAALVTAAPRDEKVLEGYSALVSLIQKQVTQLTVSSLLEDVAPLLRATPQAPASRRLWHQVLSPCRPAVPESLAPVVALVPPPGEDSGAAPFVPRRILAALSAEKQRRQAQQQAASPVKSASETSSPGDPDPTAQKLSPALTPSAKKPSPAARKLLPGKEEEFVVIAARPAAPRPLTEHQREVRAARRHIPALYADLSQDTQQLAAQAASQASQQAASASQQAAPTSQQAASASQQAAQAVSPPREHALSFAGAVEDATGAAAASEDDAPEAQIIASTDTEPETPVAGAVRAPATQTGTKVAESSSKAGQDRRELVGDGDSQVQAEGATGDRRTSAEGATGDRQTSEDGATVGRSGRKQRNVARSQLVENFLRSERRRRSLPALEKSKGEAADTGAPSRPRSQRRRTLALLSQLSSADDSQPAHAPETDSAVTESAPVTAGESGAAESAVTESAPADLDCSRPGAELSRSQQKRPRHHNENMAAPEAPVVRAAPTPRRALICVQERDGAATRLWTTAPSARPAEKTTAPETRRAEKTTAPAAQPSEKTTPSARPAEKTTSPSARPVEKTTTPSARPAEKTTLSAKAAEKTTPSARSTEKATPSAQSAEKTTAPSAQPAEKTTAPSARPAEKTTAPETRRAEKTTAPAAQPLEKTSPSARPAEKTTSPSARPAEKTTVPSARPAEKTTLSAKPAEKTTPSARSTEKATPSAQSAEKTTAPSAWPAKKTTAPSARPAEKTTLSAKPAEKTTPSARSTEKATPSAQSAEKTTSSARSTEKTTPSAQSTEKNTSSARSTEKASPAGQAIDKIASALAAGLSPPAARSGGKTAAAPAGGWAVSEARGRGRRGRRRRVSVAAMSESRLLDVTPPELEQRASTTLPGQTPPSGPADQAVPGPVDGSLSQGASTAAATSPEKSACSDRAASEKSQDRNGGEGENTAVATAEKLPLCSPPQKSDGPHVAAGADHPHISPSKDAAIKSKALSEVPGALSPAKFALVCISPLQKRLDVEPPLSPGEQKAAPPADSRQVKSATTPAEPTPGPSATVSAGESSRSDSAALATSPSTPAGSRLQRLRQKLAARSAGAVSGARGRRRARGGWRGSPLSPRHSPLSPSAGRRRLRSAGSRRARRSLPAAGVQEREAQSETAEKDEGGRKGEEEPTKHGAEEIAVKIEDLTGDGEGQDVTKRTRVRTQTVSAGGRRLETPVSGNNEPESPLAENEESPPSKKAKGTVSISARNQYNASQNRDGFPTEKRPNVDVTVSSQEESGGTSAKRTSKSRSTKRRLLDEDGMAETTTGKLSLSGGVMLPSQTLALDLLTPEAMENGASTQENIQLALTTVEREVEKAVELPTSVLSPSISGPALSTAAPAKEMDDVPAMSARTSRASAGSVDAQPAADPAGSPRKQSVLFTSGEEPTRKCVTEESNSSPRQQQAVAAGVPLIPDVDSDGGRDNAETDQSPPCKAAVKRRLEPSLLPSGSAQAEAAAPPQDPADAAPAAKACRLSASVGGPQESEELIGSPERPAVEPAAPVSRGARLVGLAQRRAPQESPERRPPVAPSVPATPTTPRPGRSAAPWCKHVYSPQASPSAGILKRRRLLGVIGRAAQSPPTPGRRRTVQFSDPPVSDRVEIPATPARPRRSAGRLLRLPNHASTEETAAPSGQGDQTAAPSGQGDQTAAPSGQGDQTAVPSGSVELTEEAGSFGPGDRTGEAAEAGGEQEKATEEASAAADTEQEPRTSPAPAPAAAPVEPRTALGSAQRPGNQTSPEAVALTASPPAPVKGSGLCPALADCTTAVTVLLPRLTSPTWRPALLRLLTSRRLSTVGDLATARPQVLERLPLRSPKIATVRSVLLEFLAQQGTRPVPASPGGVPSNLHVSTQRTVPDVSDTSSQTAAVTCAAAETQTGAQTAELATQTETKTAEHAVQASVDVKHFSTQAVPESASIATQAFPESASVSTQAFPQSADFSTQASPESAEFGAQMAPQAVDVGTQVAPVSAEFGVQVTPAGVAAGCQTEPTAVDRLRAEVDGLGGPLLDRLLQALRPALQQALSQLLNSAE